MIDPDDPKTHAALMTPSATTLGRVHWHLLRAIGQFEACAIDREPVEPLGRFAITRSVRTPFGQTAGLDPIQWWVSQGEDSLAELTSRTAAAYSAAQPLLKAAERLRDISALPKTYQAIVTRMATFADSEASHIAAVLEYSLWLRARHEFAPAMLFSHDVWGSTRRADRMIDLKGRSDEDPDLLRELTLIVFGFRDSMMPTLRLVRNRVMSDLYDSDPDMAVDEVAAESRVILQTGYEIVDAFTTYLRELRDSLRAIDRAIELQIATNDLIYDDSFWQAFITRARALALSERQHWDFKEALPFWDGVSKPERDREKQKFCEQVAAFANAAGGVLIVGIRDADRVVVGVSDLENKLKFTREVLDGCFGHSQFVIMHQVLLDHPAEGSTSCLVIIIQQHRDALIFGAVTGSYCPIRKETGLCRVPPAEVEEAKRAVRVTNHRFLVDLKGWTES